MAVTATMLDCLEKNSHVVVGDDVYGGTRRLFDRVPANRPGSRRPMSIFPIPKGSGRIRPNTRLVWLEPPTNPMLKVVDLERMGDCSRKGGSGRLR